MKRGKRNMIYRKIHISLLALLMFHSSGGMRDHDNRLGAIHQLNISEKRNSGGKEEIMGTVIITMIKTTLAFQTFHFSVGA